MGIAETILSVASVKSVLIATTVGLAVYLLIQKLKYKLPPGPFSFPLIGNYEFYTEKMPHKKYFELTKKYGPVIRVYMGPYPWIILNNVDVTLEALVKKGADFADRPFIKSFNEFTEGGKDIVFGKLSPTWKLHRKIAGKALRHYLVGENLEHTVHQACTKVVKLMKEEPGPFDPAKYCDFVVFNIICSVCFGQSYEPDDEEFVKIMELDNKLLEVFGNGLLDDIVPLLREIRPTKRYVQIMAMAEELFQILRRKYREHQETFNRDNIRDFTDSLILARKEAEEEDDKELLSQLTDTHLVQTLGDIFFAGIDSSRMTINWAILHMAGYQDIQAKVHQELDRVLGKKRQASNSSSQDRDNLGYTEAVLHEGMRVNMAAPLGVPHSTICDTTVGGYDIPKGSTVLVNHWALHHDPAYWKDVDKFDPTRYLDSDGKLSAKPESWLPFSAGRRVCLGEAVAKPELHLLFASLLQKLKIKLPEGVTTNFEEFPDVLGALPVSYKIVVEER